MSDFEKYYLEQAGNGIAFYPGIRYQRGHGVLGRLFGRVLPSLLPILKSIGKTVLGTGLDVADDVVSGKSDFKSSIKARGMSAAKDTAQSLIAKGRQKLAQSGSGMLRRRVAKRRKRTKASITIKGSSNLIVRKRKPRKASKSKRAVKGKRRPSKSGAKKKKRKSKSKPRKRRSTKTQGSISSKLPPYLSY